MRKLNESEKLLIHRYLKYMHVFKNYVFLKPIFSNLIKKIDFIKLTIDEKITSNTNIYFIKLKAM